MKRILFTLLIVTLLSSNSYAQGIGLFQDEGMSSNYCISSHDTFDVYIFIFPSAEGIYAADYRLVVPETNDFIVQEHVYNESLPIEVMMGDLFSGISMGFETCQHSNIWISKTTFINYQYPPTFDGSFYLAPTQYFNWVAVAICDADRSVRECDVIQRLDYTDWDCVGTAETSWGAIKSMYR